MLIKTTFIVPLNKKKKIVLGPLIAGALGFAAASALTGALAGTATPAPVTITGK